MSYKGSEAGYYMTEDGLRHRRIAIHLESRFETRPLITRDPVMIHDYVEDTQRDSQGNIIHRHKEYAFNYEIETTSQKEAEAFLTNARLKEALITRELFGPEVAYHFERLGSRVPTDRRLIGQARPALEDGSE